jgi:purine catabolism regulator
MSFGIPVKELLKTKHFRRNCQVIAGKKGLSNPVSWIHVLEIRDAVKESVNGKELILTTGIGFETKETALHFMRELIGQGVAGLCIETALYYPEVDQELIELAEEHDFPLIIITEISRFVDISRELNTMIINHDTELFQAADQYDHHLRMLESIGSIEEAVRYTAEYLDLQAAFLPHKGKNYFTTPGVKKMTETAMLKMSNHLENDEIFSRGTIAVKVLHIRDRDWGHLVFYSPSRDISQFEMLIIKRLASKLQHDLLLQLIKQEREIHEQNEWLRQWLHGNLVEGEVKKRMKEQHYFQQFNGYLVCAVQVPLKEKLLDDFLLHTALIVRNIFEEQGFSVLGHMEDNIITYIIMIPDDSEDLWSGLNQALEALRHTQNDFIDYRHAVFSAGKKVATVQDLGLSYETALFGLDMPGSLQTGVVFYDKLYISRMMKHLESMNVLDGFVKDHLGPLLEPANRELLHTLRIYYECNCSKQRAAEKLFIVRQTLYFRLQKIKEILGADFDEGEKRFAAEFAIHGHVYTRPVTGDKTR